MLGDAKSFDVDLRLSYLVRLRGLKGIGKAQGPDGRVRGLTQPKQVRCTLHLFNDYDVGKYELLRNINTTAEVNTGCFAI